MSFYLWSLARLAVFVALIYLVSPLQADDVPDWQVYKTKHFIVHYREHHDFARKTATRCEELYDSIAGKLGFVRHSDFWLWDNRVKIFIFESREAYLKSTRSPEWSAGRASYKERSISTYADSSGFFDSLLPHEMAHFILREFVGFKADIPLWLDEGVAQWVEEGGVEPGRVKDTMVLLLAAEGRLISLETLTHMGLREVDAMQEPMEFYAQSASIVGFLISTGGSDAFRKFCGQLRDGQSLDDALRFTYPSRIRSMKELETLWMDFIRKGLERRRQELINHGTSE